MHALPLAKFSNCCNRQKQYLPTYLFVCSWSEESFKMNTNVPSVFWYSTWTDRPPVLLLLVSVNVYGPWTSVISNCFWHLKHWSLISPAPTPALWVIAHSVQAYSWHSLQPMVSFPPSPPGRSITRHIHCPASLSGWHYGGQSQKTCFFEKL